MVRKLVAILMSAMMMFSLLSFPTETTVVSAAETPCDHILTEDDIAKLPEDFWRTHSHEEYAAGAPAFVGVQVPAGCEEDGWHIEKTETTGFCMLCGEIITEGDKVVDSAVGHDFEITLDATCDTDGTKTCKNSNYTLKVSEKDGIYTASLVSEKCNKTETIPQLGHNYQIDESQHVDPDCTNKGSDTYVCQNNPEHTYTQDIPANGHQWGDPVEVRVEPECEKEGSLTVTKTCEVCGETDVQTSTIPALEHEYEESIVQDATCYNPGIKLYTCTRCGDKYTEEIPQKPHTGLTVTKKPTCIDSGLEEGVCEKCGRSVVQSIDPLGHDYNVEIKEPTCTEDGYTLYTCKRDGCTEDTPGHSYKSDYKVKLGHDYVVDPSLDVVVDADCENPGSITHYEVCSRCSDKREASVEEIAATGHDYQLDPEQHVDPSCTEKGWDVYVCQNNPEHTYKEDIEATGHNFEITEIVEPTCTESGRNVYTCTKCGEAFVEYVPALGHKFNEDELEKIPATCVDGNIVKGECQRCGEYIVTEDNERDYSIEFENSDAYSYERLPDEVAEDTYYVNYKYTGDNSYYNEYSDEFDILGTISHTGHSYEVKYTKATCEKDGYWTLTCVREGCPDPDAETAKNEVVTVINANTAIGHKWALMDDKSDKAPTCTEDGVRHWMCLNDHSHTYTEKIPATGHTYSFVKSFEATCQEGGYNLYQCDICGAEYKEYITAKIPHNYIVTDNVAATCTTEGYDVYTCTECHDTYNKVTTAAKGHHTVEAGYVAPTCTEQGVRTYKCTNCNYTYDSYERALGHNYGKANVVKATCTEGGYTEYTCTNPGCEDSYRTEITDKVPHVLSVTDQKAATCAENGYVTRECANCDYTETEILEATGNHVYDNKVTKEATCLEDGVMTYTCQECGTEYTEVIAASGHNYGDVKVVEATCTEGGYTEYTCTNPGCEDSYRTEITDKVPHVLSVTDQKAATCTENGYVTRKCANCDYTETEEIAATGHIFDKEGVNTPATCEKEGYTTYTCSVCNKKQVIKTSEKLGHIYKSVISLPAQVGKDGIKAEVCAHCGKQIVSNKIDAIKSVTLAENKFSYTGKKIKPFVTVTDVKGKTISTKYYTVTFANNKKIGKATATIQLKGLYSGTIVKKFTITPKGVGISKTSSTKETIRYTWGKVKNADGYKIQYSTSNKFKKAKKITIKNRKTCEYYINHLKSGTNYFVRVRAYKKVSGKTYYGDWSSSSRVCK